MGGFGLGTFNARRRVWESASLFRDAGTRELDPLPTPDAYRRPAPPPRPPRRLPPFSKHAVRKTLILAIIIGGGWWLTGLVSAQSVYWNHNMRGNSDYAQGDWAGAVAEYGQMIQINPHRMDGYSLRAMAYYKVEQYRLSARDDRTAMALTAPDAVLYQNLAYSEDYYGDHRQAIADFDEAIRLDPSIPDKQGWTADADDGTGDSHKGRMWAYYATGQYALALKDCDALIARHPYPSSLAVRGKIERQMGNVAQAKADFDAALARDPHLVNAYGWEGEMLERHGQMAAALSLAREAVRNNPTNIVPLGSLGFTQYTAGEYAQAIATDNQVLARDPSQDWVRFNLALAYAVRSDGGHALPLYAEAIRRSHPDDREGAFGDLKEALNRRPESRVLKAALRLFPKGATASVSAAP